MNPARLALSLALALTFAYASLAVAPPALAHGIVIVEDAPTPTPPVHRRRPPTPPRVPVRLKDHRVHATVKGRVADVTVEQVFHNDSGRQLEGTYLFPLPEGASVSRFAMTMGGKMVEGEIMEAQQARRIYQSIVRRRRDPGLLEYMGRGLFRARVFPIEPHKDLTIRLSFQQLLPEADGTLELRYPLATDRLHGQPVESVIVSVKIESDVDLKAVYSPSHNVAVVRDGNRRAHVSYERSGRKQDKDLLLYVGRSPDDVGFSFLSNKAPGEAGTFLAVLAPSTDVPEERRQPKDVVYVLDTSGSMAQDRKMEQAKKALEYGVRTLRPGDRFNIIAFAGQVRPFREGLVDVNAEMKQAAASWIGALRAAGGTNIEGALGEALPLGTDGRLFMVVFITDGRPTLGERNTEKIAEMVQANNPAKARIFTFGVGFDLDVRFLDRIAEATHASRDYVMPREDLEVVTSRFFRKVSQPILRDVVVEFGAGIHDVYPAKLADLFAGGQVVIMGRYAAPGDRVIRLKGTLAGREVVHEYEATFGDGESAPYLPRLWAHRKVGYLLDEIRLHGENPELVQAVIRLATRHGIVTPYTAGLVVEESELQGHRDLLAARKSLEGKRAEDLGRRLRGAPAGRRGGGFVPGAGARPGDSPAPDPAVPTPRPTSPAGPPAPEREARDSEELKKLKDGRYEADEGDADDAYGLGKVRELVKAVEDKTFLFTKEKKWVDTAYDGKAETVKVEAYSDLWVQLLEKLRAKHGKKIGKYMSIGESVIFVLDGRAYEIVPPKE